MLSKEINVSFAVSVRVCGSESAGTGLRCDMEKRIYSGVGSVCSVMSTFSRDLPSSSPHSLPSTIALLHVNPVPLFLSREGAARGQ